jgi:hypothetical protein
MQERKRAHKRMRGHREGDREQQKRAQFSAYPSHIRWILRSLWESNGCQATVGEF